MNFLIYVSENKTYFIACKQENKIMHDTLIAICQQCDATLLKSVQSKNLKITHLEFISLISERKHSFSLLS